MTLHNKQIDGGPVQVVVKGMSSPVCYDDSVLRITDSGVLLVVKPKAGYDPAGWDIVAAYGIGHWIMAQPAPVDQNEI